jgi:hypothetical protein
MNKRDPDDDLRQLLERDDTRTSARHDEAVLAAARAMAEAGGSGQNAAPRTPQRRRSGWKVPLALAASFAVGVLSTLALVTAEWIKPGASQTALMLPLDATRNAGQREIPVEQAAPDEWYRYIQELIVAGEAREAELHLRRFNELHPDYAHQP